MLKQFICSTQFIKLYESPYVCQHLRLSGVRRITLNHSYLETFLHRDLSFMCNSLIESMLKIGGTTQNYKTNTQSVRTSQLSCITASLCHKDPNPSIFSGPQLTPKGLEIIQQPGCKQTLRREHWSSMMEGSGHRRMEEAILSVRRRAQQPSLWILSWPLLPAMDHGEWKAGSRAAADMMI